MSERIGLVSIGLLLFASTTSGNAYAQQDIGTSYGAGLHVTNDDNVLRQVDDVSDTSLTVTPELRLLGLYGKQSFSLDYAGEYRKYQDADELDYDAHDLKLAARLDHSQRLSSELLLQYQDDVEEPGITNQSTVGLSEFNQFDISRAQIKGAYGRSDSIGQIVLMLDHSQRRYTNNNQAFRDLDMSGITGQFFYRIAPKTRLLFEATAANIDYQNTQIFDQSSRDNIYLIGVEWDVTAKTSGTFKAGYQTKSYDNDAVFNDISGLSYSLDMTWLPNTYTKVELGASRLISESAQFGIGGFISNGFKTRLEHAFTERTVFYAQYDHLEYDITSVIGRTDKRHEFALGATHDLRTWLDIEFSFIRQERSSDEAIFEFDAQLIQLSLIAYFD